MASPLATTNWVRLSDRVLGSLWYCATFAHQFGSLDFGSPYSFGFLPHPTNSVLEQLKENLEKIGCSARK
jgi:hypothetical protein